jgi:protein-L-isoaspartate O-methyltransferase
MLDFIFIVDYNLTVKQYNGPCPLAQRSKKMTIDNLSIDNQQTLGSDATTDSQNSANDYAGLQATYSPEDNKLRLYSAYRLDSATYARINEVGFRSAPKQGCFVAPAWSPARETLLLELCGEIGDEDSTLVDRAEQRAERYDEYQGNRTTDAERAYQTSTEISGRFEFGQPILVGHHSEQRARRDKKKIDNSMRRAVTMWERAEYWSYRAKAALRHAKYKERADVRARRIKGLEADARKYQRAISEAEQFTTLWQAAGLTLARAIELANYDYVTACFPLADYPREAPAPQSEDRMSLRSALDGGVIGAEQARAIACKSHALTIGHYARWLAHVQHRIAYERAMLEEAGGLAGAAFNYEIGGRVLVRGEWLTVLRVNKKDGAVRSVTTNSRYVAVKHIEEIKDYRAPAPETAAAVTAKLAKPSLCNYPGDGFEPVTQKEWNAAHADYKGTREAGKDAQVPGGARVNFADTSAKYQRHRVRIMQIKNRFCPVYIVDRKRVDPSEVPNDNNVPQLSEIEGPASVYPRTVYTRPEATKFDALRDVLKSGGAQTVCAPQLFLTLPDLADEMVVLAGMVPGLKVLEPSAGTGRICAAIGRAVDISTIDLTTVEVNPNLSMLLRSSYPDNQHICADFLGWNCDGGQRFDRIIMNPPFANAADIRHIQHALQMLKPGGRLVAICANGPRQEKQLLPLFGPRSSWKDLPANSFKSSGTNVNTALILIDR